MAMFKNLGNKMFKEGSLGSAAIGMLDVLDLKESPVLEGLNPINSADSIVVIRKTDEVKKELDKAQLNGADIVIGNADGTLKISALDIAEAIKKFTGKDAGGSLAGVSVVDMACVHNLDNEPIFTFVVAPAKAANSQTKYIVQGTVTSIHAICQATNHVTTSKASIKDSSKRAKLPRFARRKLHNNSEVVIKNVSVGDHDIPVLVDMGNLHDYDSFNDLVEITRRHLEILNQNALRDYATRHTPTVEDLITALRVQNRSYADNLFLEKFQARYGELEFSEQNIAKVEMFTKMRKQYHASWSGIGSGSNLSDYTLTMGFNALKVTTDQQQIFNSKKTLGKVKKNQVNSYFRIKPEDTGRMTAICTEDDRTAFLYNTAPAILKAMDAWIYNESIHFLNGDPSYLVDVRSLVDDLECPQVEDLKAYQLLGMTEEDNEKAVHQLIQAYYKAADMVINNADHDADIAVLNKFTEGA